MKLTYEIRDLIPKRVFRTARTTSASSESVFVEISDGELSGIGEAAPSRFYGETAETVVAMLEKMRPVVEGSRHESELMAELVSRWGPDNPAARASLDMAGHDMMARRYGVPLYRHFGLDPFTAPTTTMSIGLDAADVMVEKALEASDFPMLKVKLDRDTDLDVVSRIKAATGARVTVDANCAWDVAGAIERSRELERIGVEFIEQPVAADDVEGLAAVRAAVGVPIFADESCPTERDMERVGLAVDGVVIKLMKCGGLVEALRMARRAKAMGLMTMLGCMIESSLAITAAAHISPLVDYADLDSGLLLRNDPYTGVRIEAGRMFLPDSPGLGVERVRGLA